MAQQTGCCAIDPSAKTDIRLGGIQVEALPSLTKREEVREGRMDHRHFALVEANVLVKHPQLPSVCAPVRCDCET